MDKVGQAPDLWRYELQAAEHGYRCVAGVDEAGRGPLAGPVVAAAVVLPSGMSADGIRDSKKLTPLQREDAYARIMAEAVAAEVGIADTTLIDRINILQATYQAMRRALNALCVRVDHVLVDGRAIPELGVSQQGIPHGDALSVSIAAASIVAKVTRDRIMEDMDGKYPGYGFAKHKGYCTAEHLSAIYRIGICEIHRRSFSPISEEVNSSCEQKSLF